MEKVFEIQKTARENVQSLKTYLTDLDNWEAEMKRKEAALQGKSEQELPPIRSKLKKEKPVVQREKKPRITSSDYQSWEKFDVDAACEEVDTADIGPISLDSKRSEPAKMEKLREEAQYEKERGNAFVKQSKWDDAIKCYNQAINLYKDDAIFYANRGLCHLKNESLHNAESDCTEAIRLDPTYVKAYQRRAAAREKLGSLRAASNDLAQVLELEPQNKTAKAELDLIKQRMGTKGSKSKSSPATTPTVESKPLYPPSPKIVELEDKEPTKMKEVSTKRYTEQQKRSQLDGWKDGSQDGVHVVKPVHKPPHLRSKKPLKLIPIEEIELGETEAKRGSRMKIIEIDDGGQSDIHKDTSNTENVNKVSNTKNKASGDTNKDNDKENKHSNSSPQHNDNTIINEKTNGAKIIDENDYSPIVESPKLSADALVKENNNNFVILEKPVPPTTSVQFICEWKCLKGNDNARLIYLSVIDPAKIPAIFQNSLECDILSEILHTMSRNPEGLRSPGKNVAAYLKGLSAVKRFSALSMFLSANDKEVVKNLLQFCKQSENIKEDEINDLRNKYEI